MCTSRTSRTAFYNLHAMASGPVKLPAVNFRCVSRTRAFLPSRSHVWVDTRLLAYVSRFDRASCVHDICSRSPDGRRGRTGCQCICANGSARPVCRSRRISLQEYTSHSSIREKRRRDTSARPHIAARTRAELGSRLTQPRRSPHALGSAAQQCAGAPQWSDGGGWTRFCEQ